MKKIFGLFLAAVVAAPMFMSCGGNAVNVKTQNDSINYALGAANAGGIRQYVLMEDTADANKIKDFFKKDSAITAMNPVSEFVNPAIGGSITKGFGVQDASASSFHYGVDIKTAPSQNITSCAKGEVTEIATNSEYGSYILIKHSDEISTLYANLGEIFPDIGASVESGQAIARANNDNNTIYFEIKKGDTYLNPEEFIDFKNGGAND